MAIPSTPGHAGSIYTPVEHTIIRHYLGRAPGPSGTGIHDLRILENEDDEQEGIELQAGLFSDHLNLDLAVANAVARIALQAVQHRLPQLSYQKDGEWRLGRHVSGRRPRGSGAVSIAPQYLLTIDWGGGLSGSGYPEAYYVGWLPEYEVNIVTASEDSPDTFGYCDRAIGWFDAARELVEGATEVVAGLWDWHPSRSGWQALLGTGLIDTEATFALAHRIWPESSTIAKAEFLATGGASLWLRS